VQSDGATIFDQPIPVCFPNVANPITGDPPLEPGAKSALWACDHDLGDWVFGGSMTVSADATLICSDPGVGIEQPGWHGTTPTAPLEGPEDNCPECCKGDCCEPNCCDDNETKTLDYTKIAREAMACGSEMLTNLRRSVRIIIGLVVETVN